MENTNKKKELDEWCKRKHIILNHQQKKISDEFLKLPKGCGKSFLLRTLLEFEVETGN